VADPAIEKDEDAVATLDFFSGAIHALFLARHHGFKNRKDRSPSTPAVRKIARDLSGGKLRIEGAWLAGFHFNSGLARLAGVYERSMKLASGLRDKNLKKWKVEEGACRIHGRWTGSAWEHANIEAVYVEVNKLKHATGGVQAGRDVSSTDALEAIGELLALLEAWRDAGCPK